MILDTTFVIDLFRKDKSAVDKARELDSRGEALFTTAVTIFELWQGLGAKKEKKKENLAQFVEAFGLLNFDPESAKHAGEIHAELKSRGLPIDAGDSMIAGMALHLSQPLLTRDKHFSRVKGIRIETY